MSKKKDPFGHLNTVALWGRSRRQKIVTTSLNPSAQITPSSKWRINHTRLSIYTAWAGTSSRITPFLQELSLKNSTTKIVSPSFLRNPSSPICCLKGPSTDRPRLLSTYPASRSKIGSKNTKVNNSMLWAAKIKIKNLMMRSTVHCLDCWLTSIWGIA